MADIITKDGITYFSLERGSVILAAWLESGQWAQKTKPTKIYYAYPGEDISQMSKERDRLIQAEGNEVIFDNGHIPVRFNNAGEVIEVRHDRFIPTNAQGELTGARIRDKNYQQIAKGVEEVVTPAFNGGEGWARDYGYYLPLPNPRVVCRPDYPVYIPNAFGSGDHQFLTQPVIRLERKEDVWYVAGGLNGPEFNTTWTPLGSHGQMNIDEARFHAQIALRKSARKFRQHHILITLRSLPLRFGFWHWISRPEIPANKQMRDHNKNPGF